MDASPIPVGGFVRMPSAWLALPISPQAKILLVIFCDAADDQGASYYSFEQLGEILQRSKGSVCAYVKELKEQRLITCTTQTYGNGYNYRLLIRVAGWAEILEHWARLAEQSQARRTAASGERLQAAAGSRTSQPCPPASRTAAAKARDRWKQPKPAGEAVSEQNTERRVDQAECKDPTGPIIHHHQTQTPHHAMQVEWTEKDEDEWRHFRPSDRDPPFQQHGTPSPALLRRVVDFAAALEASAGLLEPEDARARCETALREFVDCRRLEATALELREAAERLAQLAPSPNAIRSSMESLALTWKPHWRRLSSPKQIQEAVAAAAEQALPSRSDRERLGRFKTRSWIASRRLAQAPSTPSLSVVPHPKGVEP